MAERKPGGWYKTIIAAFIAQTFISIDSMYKLPQCLAKEIFYLVNEIIDVFKWKKIVQVRYFKYQSILSGIILNETTQLYEVHDKYKYEQKNREL